MNISMKIPMAMLIAALPLTVQSVQAETTVGTTDRSVQQRQVDNRQANDAHLRDAMNLVSLQRISQQMDKDVYGMDDKKIGVIEDIVLDGQDNRIAYAVLSFGGVMGVGDKYFAIPWSSIEHRAEHQDRVYLNIDADRLKKAPGFDKNNWPDTASAGFRTSVDTYYGVNDLTRSDWYHRNNIQRPDNQWQRTASGVNTTMERDVAATRDKNNNRAVDADKDMNTKDATSRTADKTRANNDRINKTDKSDKTDRHADRHVSVDQKDHAADMGPRDAGLIWSRRASAVLGTDVRNSKAEDIGEINDLVIDPRTGDVRYAILSFGGMMGVGDKLFAVPMDRIQTSSSDREFVIDISKETLKNAKGFEDNNWPDWNDTQYQDSVDKVFKDLPRHGNAVNYAPANRHDKAAVHRADLDRRNDADRKNVDRNKTDRNNADRMNDANRNNTDRNHNNTDRATPADENRTNKGVSNDPTDM